MRKKIIRNIGIVAGGLVGCTIIAAVIGSMTSLQIIQMTRKTTATREQIWELWENVPDRTRWDGGLEYIRINGPFEAGTTGVVKLKDFGDPTAFQITYIEPLTANSERYFLPFFTHMDWHHIINETPDGLEITFTVEVSGPTALVLAPILSNLLQEELPQTVEKLISTAEES